MNQDFVVKKISKHVFRIGEPGVPIFLVNAESPVIIDSGYSFSAEKFGQAIKSILGHRHPSWCFITHSHFDHVGSAGYFKKIFPEMQIAASAMAADILSSQGAIERIEKLNEFASGLYAKGLMMANSSSFIPFIVDRRLQDGDLIELGQSERLTVIDTPGHTRDSLCFFLEPDRVLFSGDAAGIRHGDGYVFFDFLVDCDVYIKSLFKISKTEASVICQGHYDPISGDFASEYLKELPARCEESIMKFKSILDDCKGDVDLAMKNIKKWEYDILDQPKQPEPAYMLNLGARTRSASRWVGSIIDDKY